MNAEQLEFILTTIMVLVSMIAGYLGARLYKRSWRLRMTIVIVPVALNALLYLVYDKDSFLYLGGMLLLFIPFVWPRKSA